MVRHNSNQKKDKSEYMLANEEPTEMPAPKALSMGNIHAELDKPKEDNEVADTSMPEKGSLQM